jgi:aspartate/methionine/tyrosine aminotransferase
MVEEFRRRRDAFCSALNEIPGWHCEMPGGAFYAFANVKKTGQSSKEIADRLLNEAGVACLNGASFGAFGEGYLRFSYANSLENLMTAVERIRAWMGEPVGPGADSVSVNATFDPPTAGG